ALSVTQGEVLLEGPTRRLSLQAEGEDVPSSLGSGPAAPPWMPLQLHREPGRVASDLPRAPAPARPRTQVLALLMPGRAAADRDDRGADAALAFAGDQLAAPVTRYLEQRGGPAAAPPHRPVDRGEVAERPGRRQQGADAAAAARRLVQPVLR